MSGTTQPLPYPLISRKDYQGFRERIPTLPGTWEAWEKKIEEVIARYRTEGAWSRCRFPQGRSACTCWITLERTQRANYGASPQTHNRLPRHPIGTRLQISDIHRFAMTLPTHTKT
jgi:hypothetical protein